MKDFAALPLVVGAGAGERAYALLAALAEYPNIRKIMQAAVCVGERRWDLQLEPGVTVQLPEGKEAEGLRKLNNLLAESQILSRTVQSVDLRLPDRIAIEKISDDKPATKTAKSSKRR